MKKINLSAKKIIAKFVEINIDIIIHFKYL